MTSGRGWWCKNYNRLEYDAYGQLYSGSLDASSYRGYNGKKNDPVTGMYDYGFRHYSPERKQWLTVDPIRDGDNWRLYCVGDPVNNTDLWGLLSLVDDVVGWSAGRIFGTRNDGFIEGVGQNFIESWKNVGNSINTFENNKTIGDWVSDAAEFVTRNTWNAPNEIIGNVASYGAIQLFGAKTRRFEDVQLTETKVDFGAFTIGSKVVGGYDTLKDPLIAKHEQGHYYQGLITGPLYVHSIAMPSLIHAAIYDRNTSTGSYYDFYTEKWANKLGGVECLR